MFLLLTCCLPPCRRPLTRALAAPPLAFPEHQVSICREIYLMSNRPLEFHRESIDFCLEQNPQQYKVSRSICFLTGVSVSRVQRKRPVLILRGVDILLEPWSSLTQLDLNLIQRSAWTFSGCELDPGLRPWSFSHWPGSVGGRREVESGEQLYWWLVLSSQGIHSLQREYILFRGNTFTSEGIHSSREWNNKLLWHISTTHALIL